MKKTIGILGGMGPYATVYFFKHILDLTVAPKEWDHARLIIDSHPHIPSRTRHLLFEEASPVDGMIDACRRLQQYPVDMIAIPCNSAQAWRDDVQAAIDVPILNIMEITVDATRRSYPNASRIIVLGGRVTWVKRTYEAYVRASGYTYHAIDESLQVRVEQVIEAVKVQRNLQAAVKEVEAIAHEACKGRDNAVVVLGCTEFGCIKDLLTGFSWVDSATEYARKVVELSGAMCRT